MARIGTGSGARCVAAPLLTLALLGLALAGCVAPSSRLGVATRTLAGHWNSTTGPFAIDVTLSLHRTHVSGSGTFIDGQDRRAPLSVTGEYTAPDFSLQLASHDQLLGRFVGRVDSSDTLRGMLYDAGIPADSVILTRLRVRDMRPLFRPAW